MPKEMKETKSKKEEALEKIGLEQLEESIKGREGRIKK
jgi:hypothetical protein